MKYESSIVNHQVLLLVCPLTLEGTEKAYTHMCIMTRNNKKEDMNLKETKERYMGEGRKERETCNHILKK